MKRRYLDWAGWFLCGVSLLFVLWTLWSQRAGLEQWQPGLAALGLMLAGVVVYLGGIYLQSGNWRRLLAVYAPGIGTPVALRSLYARSQIGKYLPGNVVHLAARHVMGRQLGLGHGALSLAALLELAGLVVAALTIAVVAEFLNTNRAFSLPPGVLAALAVLAAAAFLLAPAVLVRLGDRTQRLLPAPRKGSLAAMVQVYGLYVLSLLFGGLALLLLSSQFMAAMGLQVAMTVIAVFGLAFLLGLVTPGAPSGLGVREAVIVLALDGMMPPAQAVLLALLFRVLTISADVLFLALAMLEQRLTQQRLVGMDEP